MFTKIKERELKALGEVKRITVARFFSYVELRSDDGLSEELSINEAIDLLFDDEISLILQAIDGDLNKVNSYGQVIKVPPEMIFSDLLNDHGVSVERFY